MTPVISMVMEITIEPVVEVMGRQVESIATHFASISTRLHTNDFWPMKPSSQGVDEVESMGDSGRREVAGQVGGGGRVVGGSVVGG